MRVSSDLYDLVATMSASEKRYFRLNAQTQGAESQYLWIFEAVEHLNANSEADFVASIEDLKVRKQFPVMKSYLYRQILKSLRNFHNERSVDIQLRELLTNADLLNQRGLHVQAQKQLDRAEKLAIRFEKFDFLLQIANFRLNLTMQQSAVSLDKLQIQLESVFASQAKYFKHFEDLVAYKELALRMLLQNRREQYVSTDDGKEAYSKLFGNPLISNPENAESNRAKLFCSQSRFIYFLAIHDFDSSFEAAGEIVNLMELMPELLDENPENYINSLQNLITVSTLKQEDSVSLALIEHLKRYQENIPSIKFPASLNSRVGLFAINLEIQILMEGRQMAKAADRIDEAKAVLDSLTFEPNVNAGFVVLSLHFHISQLALFKGLHRLALQHLNLIFNDSGIDATYEIFTTAKLLQVMVYFDAGETHLLESALLSLYRILQKRERLQKFDRILIQALRKRVDFPANRDLKPWFRDLLAELRAIVEGNQDSPSMHQREIFYWLDAKLSE